VILFAVGTEELLAHPADALGDAVRWAFVGGLMLVVGSQSIMVWRFTRQYTWERFALLGLLGLAALTLADLRGAVLAALVAVVLLATLSVESARHREALRQLR
jgi:hypothetical protein